jgi:hypothetical protein
MSDRPVGHLPELRERLVHRLQSELGDPSLAEEVVGKLDEVVLDPLAALVGEDFHTSPVLSFRPTTVAPDQVDSLWVLAFGYRLPPGVAPLTPGSSEIPPMGDLSPGPVNEALAASAAAFVARTPVPVIAQWEVARVLADLGVEGVISVEPDHHADGSVVYLSTAGVVEKGKRLAAEAGVVVGHAGILGHRDHVSRCIMTARGSQLPADLPETIELPTGFDPESGQSWTRTRREYIALDLFARAFTPPEWFHTSPGS